MANQAIAILYDLLNGMDDVSADRAFVPWKDMAAAMRAAGVPLFTLECVTAVRDCDLLGITLPYELTYTNVLEALDLAGIPLRAVDRGAADPLVVGGGPCAFNPEPVADFFDAMLIGEGEEAVLDIVGAHRAARDAGASRARDARAARRGPGRLRALALRGRGARTRPRGPRAAVARPRVVVKRVLSDLDAFRTPSLSARPVHGGRPRPRERRGAARLHARLPLLPGGDDLPARARAAGRQHRARRARASSRCTGYDELSLTSLSTTDHSQIEEVLRRLTQALRGKAVNIGLPSLRVDSFGIAMARLVGEGRKGGLTFAPEAGTQRLRDVINKNVTEEDLLATVDAAFGEGWRRLKLYFMIGLPTETDEDVRGIGELVVRVLETARAATPPAQRGSVKIGVSVSTFVPKAHTPFQWEGQLTLEQIREQAAHPARGGPAQGRRPALARRRHLAARRRAGAWRPRARGRHRAGVARRGRVRRVDRGVLADALARRVRRGGPGPRRAGERAPRPAPLRCPGTTS